MESPQESPQPKVEEQPRDFTGFYEYTDLMDFDLVGEYKNIL